MKKGFMFCALFLVICLVLLNGCSFAPASLAPSSTPVTPGSYKVLGHAQGTASYYSVLGIIPINHPNYDAAINDALQQFAGGKSLINVRSYYSTLYLYLVNISTLTVEGDVITDN
jgi:hypothetical protein